jgi:hypothetical protein
VKGKLTKALILAALGVLAISVTGCFERPPGWTDAEWFTWVSTYGDSETVDVSPPEQYVDPPDAEGSTAVAAGGRCKTITNTRQKTERVDPSNPATKAPVLSITLRTTWCYSGGQVRKLYPAYAHCLPTLFGEGRGWTCDNPNGHKELVKCFGGSPEHCGYFYSFDIHRDVATKIGPFAIQHDVWCAGNQVSGSGAHVRHGHCSPQPWS